MLSRKCVLSNNCIGANASLLLAASKRPQQFSSHRMLVSARVLSVVPVNGPLFLSLSLSLCVNDPGLHELKDKAGSGLYHICCM